MSDHPEDLQHWLNKDIDAEMGRINGIPIVPGRPYPHRPPAEYRIKPRLIAWSGPVGKSPWYTNHLHGEVFEHAPIAPEIRLWPAQSVIISGRQGGKTLAQQEFFKRMSPAQKVFLVNKTRAQGPSA